MGYLLFELEEAGFKTVLAQLRDALSEAGTDSNGKTKIHIHVQGAKEKTLSVEVASLDELLDILKLNTD